MLREDRIQCIYEMGGSPSDNTLIIDLGYYVEDAKHDKRIDLARFKKRYAQFKKEYNFVPDKSMAPEVQFEKYGKITGTITKNGEKVRVVIPKTDIHNDGKTYFYHKDNSRKDQYISIDRRNFTDKNGDRYRNSMNHEYGHKIVHDMRTQGKRFSKERREGNKTVDKMMGDIDKVTGTKYNRKNKYKYGHDLASEEVFADYHMRQNSRKKHGEIDRMYASVQDELDKSNKYHSKKRDEYSDKVKVNSQEIADSKSLKEFGSALKTGIRNVRKTAEHASKSNLVIETDGKRQERLDKLDKNTPESVKNALKSQKKNKTKK